MQVNKITFAGREGLLNHLPKAANKIENAASTYFNPRTVISEAVMGKAEKSAAQEIAESVVHTPYNYRAPFQLENAEKLHAKAAQIEYAKAQGKSEEYVNAISFNK